MRSFVENLQDFLSLTPRIKEFLSTAKRAKALLKAEMASVQTFSVRHEETTE
jgi:hypothetical protein